MLGSASRALALLIALLVGVAAPAATFFVDPTLGRDEALGTSPTQAWRTLARAGRAELRSGDQLLLAAGPSHEGRLYFESLRGTAEAPIVIGRYVPPGGDERAAATIDGRGKPAAVGLKNCQHVVVEDLVLTADGGTPVGSMRCGVLVEAAGPGEYRGISLRRLQVKSVSFEAPDFARPAADVKTANGTGRYGWGIRFIVQPGGAVMRDVSVRDCTIERVDHTGLKFTAPTDGIRDVIVERVHVAHTGGPGIQMSGLAGGRFAHLTVTHSGSTADSRNWGRGSGLWTWGTRDVVIERSRFTHANGPGDSAGVHLDYHCRNIVVQYNVSAHNAGGFCEILGNNHNCAYRYNLSINDGHRVKGRDGAFQEGKIFWLSGYVGSKQTPKGPFNSYFYNNTIYVGADIVTKFALAPTAAGVLVANNIFCVVGPSTQVAGDQFQSDRLATRPIERAVMTHNLFLRADTWPKNLGFTDAAPITGDPQFKKPGGDQPADYTPQAVALIKDRGIPLSALPGDPIGLTVGLQVTTDLLGQPIVGQPDLGAIELPATAP